MARNYSSTAQQTTLASGITSGATSIQVTATTGFPSVDFVLALDADTAQQELVLVTAVAGTTLTVTRGYDSTTAVAHDAGAVVRHSHAGIDFRDSRTHEAATTAHGATGAVVGTTNTQTLTNKTISADSNTLSGIAASSFVLSNGSGNIDGSAAQKVIPAGAVVGTSDTQTLTNKTISADSNTLSGIAASSFVVSNGSGNIDGSAAQKVIPAGVVVGTTDAQTLTNKTLALGSNAVSGTTAEFNTALSDGNFATLAGAETLTSKTLDSPVITGIGAVSWTAKAADETVTSSTALQNDNHLSASIPANGTYAFRLVLFGTCASATPDLKMAFTSPAGTLLWGTLAPDVASNVTGATSTYRTQTGSGNTLSVGAGTDFMVVVEGTFVATATGTLQFQWAQDVSNASGVTLKLGSTMRVERIA